MASFGSCRTMALSLLLVTSACASADSAGVTMAALNAEDVGSDEACISLLQLRAHRSREALVQALRAASSSSATSSASVEAQAESSEHALLRAEAADAMLAVAQADAQAGTEADLGAEMTEDEAQAICAQIPGCKGFTMQYQPTSDSPVVINMKNKEALLQVQSVEDSSIVDRSSTESSSFASNDIASIASGATSASTIDAENRPKSNDANLAEPTDTTVSTEALSISNLVATLTGNEEADDTQEESRSDEHLTDGSSKSPHSRSSNIERSKPDKPLDILDGAQLDGSHRVATPTLSKPSEVDTSSNSSNSQAWSLADVAHLLLEEAKAQEAHKTEAGSSEASASGGRSLGEVAQEILRLANVEEASDGHSIRSNDETPHAPTESTTEPTSDALSARPSMQATFEDVDGGEGRACRGLSKVDHSEMYFTAEHADSLATCKESCLDAHSCVGLSFNSRTLRCEVWRRPAYIGMSVAEAHGYCARYHGPETSSLSTAPESAAVSEAEAAAEPAAAASDESVQPAVPLGAASITSDAPAEHEGVSAYFESVDGGSGRSCRGASPTDHADEYYSSEKGKTLVECQETCISRHECVGIEYRSLTGRCEVWTRPAGIGASEEVANSECLRRLHAVDTAGLAKAEAQLGAEEPSGSDIFQQIEKLGAKLEDRRDGTSDIMQELRTAAKELAKVETERKAQEEAKAKRQAEKREKRRSAKKEAESRAHTILPGDGAEKVSSVIIGEVAKLGTKILDLQSNGAASSKGRGEAVFSEHVDYAFAGDNLGDLESMTLEQAKKKCAGLSACHAFNFQGSPASVGPAGAVDVQFKSAWNAAGHGWSSFQLEVDHAAAQQVREALAEIHAAELKASTAEAEVAEHTAQVPEMISASQTGAVAASNRTFEFEAVDGGMDRACRGQKESDSFGWYYDLNSAETLDECKKLCLSAPVCKGIEFNSEVGVCEVWTRKEGIGMTEAAEGYQCHRLRAVQDKAPTVSETTLVGSVGKASKQSSDVQEAWSSMKRLNLGFEAVDGGSGRTCRGSANDDINDSYFDLGTAATLDECKVRCLQAAVCVGVDFGSGGSQCKLWKRAAGISGSAQETGHECHRFLGIGASYSQLKGYAFAGGEMLVDSMAVGQAKAKCASLHGCKGFTYEDAAVSSGSPMEVRFKSEWASSCHGWTSFRMEPDATTASAIESQTSEEPPKQLAKLGSDLFDQFEKLSTEIAKGIQSSSVAVQPQRSLPGGSGEGRVTPQAVQEMINGALNHDDETKEQELTAEAVREMISKALGNGVDDVAKADEAHLLERQQKRAQREERRQVKLQEQEEEEHRRRREELEEEEEEEEHRHAMQAEHARRLAADDEDARKEEPLAEVEKQQEEGERRHVEKDDELILEKAMRAAEEAARALSKFQENEVPTGAALKAELQDIKKAVAAAQQAAALVSRSQAASKSPARRGSNSMDPSAEGDDATSARAEKITKIARLGTSLFKKIAALGSRINAA